MLTHFSAVLLFSLFTSVVFGITQRSEPKMMVRFGAFCFVLFVGGTIAASWLMWLIKHYRQGTGTNERRKLLWAACVFLLRCGAV